MNIRFASQLDSGQQFAVTQICYQPDHLKSLWLYVTQARRVTLTSSALDPMCNTLPQINTKQTFFTRKVMMQDGQWTMRATVVPDGLQETVGGARGLAVSGKRLSMVGVKFLRLSTLLAQIASRNAPRWPVSQIAPY